MLATVADTWANIRRQAYFFGRLRSDISIVLEQKTIAFQNIGGHRPMELCIENAIVLE